MSAERCKLCGEMMDKPGHTYCPRGHSFAPVSGLEAGLCECAHWARSINLKYLTNHHENCPRYNDSLMDVWKVTVDGRTTYCEHEQDARETAGDEHRDDITITKERMHREVFEHLPEFEGF